MASLLPLQEYQRQCKNNNGSSSSSSTDNAQGWEHGLIFNSLISRSDVVCRVHFYKTRLWVVVAVHLLLLSLLIVDVRHQKKKKSLKKNPVVGVHSPIGPSAPPALPPMLPFLFLFLCAQNLFTPLYISRPSFISLPIVVTHPHSSIKTDRFSLFVLFFFSSLVFIHSSIVALISIFNTWYNSHHQFLPHFIFNSTPASKPSNPRYHHYTPLLTSLPT